MAAIAIFYINKNGASCSVQMAYWGMVEALGLFVVAVTLRHPEVENCCILNECQMLMSLNVRLRKVEVVDIL